MLHYSLLRLSLACLLILITVSATIAASTTQQPAATKAATRKATAIVQIGTSPVPVGTLTASALSSSISSAVLSLCPSVTQTTTSTTCKETTKVKIPKIIYISKKLLQTDGELVVQIDSSGYNDTAMLKPLADMAALSISSSATGANCRKEDYTVIEGKIKRWSSSAFDTTLALFPFHKRDHPHAETGNKMTLCNAGHFASPQLYSDGWRQAPKPGPSNYISVAMTFQTGSSGELTCAFIDGLIESAEAILTPELLGVEQPLDGMIDISCKGAMSYLGG
ncbi:MAG: hypothetical protein M1812_007254 [Candelaria pacifica]|nr:MAG: hypothetical protein M1812_007254 [Candelaria pacifica]